MVKISARIEVESPMVIDDLWVHKENAYCEVEEKLLKGPGYEEIGTKIFVPEEYAYDYALERISQKEDEKKEFVEWFYSDNWIKED